METIGQYLVIIYYVNFIKVIKSKYLLSKCYRIVNEFYYKKVVFIFVRYFACLYDVFMYFFW